MDQKGRQSALFDERKKREDSVLAWSTLATMTPSIAILDACRLIQSSPVLPTLDVLAQSARMSRFHFQRCFRKEVGITPRQFASALRDERIRGALAKGGDIQQALLDAGFGSSSRFYDGAIDRLGMKPSQYQDKGRGACIRVSMGECSLGSFLVAASDDGICQISLGDEPEALFRELQDRFAHATLKGSDPSLDAQVVQVVSMLENPSMSTALPLDIRGTVFQQQVWSVLRQIPCGQTLSYSEVARLVGRPLAHRAVASACAANHLAVAIPCHRVVKNDGALSGYRWGVERKRKLLDQEAVSPEPCS